MKITLKAPGTKRLKLKYDKLLSSLAFNFNLRCYSVVRGQEQDVYGKFFTGEWDEENPAQINMSSSFTSTSRFR
jgi:hypothetical protein